jgi:hypothetical protein
MAPGRGRRPGGGAGGHRWAHRATGATCAPTGGPGRDRGVPGSRRARASGLGIHGSSGHVTRTTSPGWMSPGLPRYLAAVARSSRQSSARWPAGSIRYACETMSARRDGGPWRPNSLQFAKLHQALQASDISLERSSHELPRTVLHSAARKVSPAVDGADVPGGGNRESTWIGPARRHALSVRSDDSGF